MRIQTNPYAEDPQETVLPDGAFRLIDDEGNEWNVEPNPGVGLVVRLVGIPDHRTHGSQVVIHPTVGNTIEVGPRPRPPHLLPTRR